MADVVACPTCAKEYRLPPAPPPAFTCRACGTAMDLSAFRPLCVACLVVQVVLLALLLLARSGMAADPPARERASGFTFVRPEGWSQSTLDDGTIAIQPPGADAQQCSLFIFPGQDDAELGAQVFHDRMVEALTRNSTVEGTIERDTLGVWRRSVCRITAAQGKPSWLGIYSAKSGSRLEVLMFVAQTEKLFGSHRPAVEGLLASVEFPGAKSAPARGAIHGLVIPHPPEWQRKDDPDGVVQLVPPQIPGVRQYLLAVFPPNRLQGSHWDAHRQMLKDLLKQAQWTGGEPVVIHRPEGPGIFIVSEAAGRTAAGEGRQLTLYTAVHDGIMEAVLGVHQIDRNVVDPVLKATRFEDPPKAEARPKIAQAYRRIKQRMHIDPRGGAMIAGSLLYDRLWLRADGVADFTTYYPEGYAASLLPMKVDPSLQNGDYGSWKAVDGKIQITRSAGKTLVYEPVEGGMKGDGQEWEVMPRVDGLRLSGRWEVKSPPGEKTAPYHHWIEFTPEGRFETEGVLESLTVGDVDPYRAPAKAAGAYEIRDWTMFFRFDDGSTWSTDFSVLGKEITPDMSILFRTSVFGKAK